MRQSGECPKGLLFFFPSLPLECFLCTYHGSDIQGTVFQAVPEPLWLGLLSEVCCCQDSQRGRVSQGTAFPGVLASAFSANRMHLCWHPYWYWRRRCGRVEGTGQRLQIEMQAGFWPCDPQQRRGKERDQPSYPTHPNRLIPQWEREDKKLQHSPRSKWSHGAPFANWDLPNGL